MKQRAKPVAVEVRSLGETTRRPEGRAKGRPKGRPRAEPTPERLRHAAGDFERGHNGQMTMRDSPLERTFARGVISEEQYAAARKYRHHWYHAGLSGHLTSFDPRRVPATDLFRYDGLPRTEAQLFHRQRYREAVQAVGKLGSHVLDWTVCREVALDRFGETLGWTNRAQAYAAAAERLKIALDELCRLWGIGN